MRRERTPKNMENTVELSQRLRAVAGLVTAGSRAADIGCDHGYVSVWLVQKGICPHVIAMDVNRGPLRRAQKTIEDCGAEEYIETRLSDGARELKEGEADSLILAGMGGRLMLRILSESRPVTRSMAEWILQPQSELRLVRRTLRQQGCRIAEEDMVEEDGKFYAMFRVTPGSGIQETETPEQSGRPAGENGREQDVSLDTEAEDRYGGLLLRQRHPVLKRYLERESKKLQEILERLDAAARQRGGTDRNLQRRRELFREQEVLACAMSRMEA